MGEGVGRLTGDGLKDGFLGRALIVRRRGRRRGRGGGGGLAMGASKRGSAMENPNPRRSQEGKRRGGGEGGEGGPAVERTAPWPGLREDARAHKGSTRHSG